MAKTSSVQNKSTKKTQRERSDCPEFMTLEQLLALDLTHVNEDQLALMILQVVSRKSVYKNQD